MAPRTPKARTTPAPTKSPDAGELRVDARDGGVRFAVRVGPRAARERIGEVVEGALKVFVHAAPVDGAANRAVCELLARRLGVAKSAVRIVSGEQSRNKTVFVAEVDARALAALTGRS